ncbi:MAG TPA: UDP-N-acetylglucosamine 2-epimerase, partial [Allosphingosinicella sp.]
ANLAAEPRVTGAVYVTGNSGIDALLHARGSAAGPRLDAKRKTILVTCHRRENRAGALARICMALKSLVAEMPVEIVFALHPNRHIRAAIETMLANIPHISLIEPLPYPEMVGLMDASWLILTDSGGLQEEGPALGRPVLVMREVTERTEAPANVALVGTEPRAILAAVHRLLMDEVRYARMSSPALPFGDGHAAPRIAILIEDFIAGRTRLAL